MGAFLSTPSVEKVSSDEDGQNVAYGASSMQGWRMSQEDAHNCLINFDDNVSLFAVYDGHGGHDVSTYCSQYLPEFIKNIESYKQGDIKQALIDAFLGFDASLKTPKVIQILKEIAKGDSADSDNEGDNVARLRLEASMPIEQVLSKYQTDIEDCIMQKSQQLSQLKENNSGEASSSGASSSGVSGSSSAAGSSSGAGSSFAAGSSTGAGSSSGVGSTSNRGVSRQWENNDTNVGGSSRQCESASSSGSKNKAEASNSSEADQELDSTTSNGDAAPTSQVGSSADSKPVKASEMPDSSEDADEKISAGKVTNSTPAPSDAEVNGEVKKNLKAADSSKSINDGECSGSSGAPVENGEAGQQEKISSSGSKNKNSNNIQDLLNDTSDDDTDDENYEHDLSDADDFSEEENAGLRMKNRNDDAEENEDEDDDNGDDDDDDDDEDEDEDEDEDDDDSFETDDVEPGVDSGCTAVVAILKDNELYVANAGDSRCVLCRAGEAVELSFDHKPEDQIEMDRIVEAGGKVTSDGRVNGGLNLSRAIGDHAYKKNKNVLPEKQMISALPDIQTITIDREKDEFMVLACDGIWNSMSSQCVVDFVRERMKDAPNKSLSKICEELFEKCLAPDTDGDGTGCDNMTAIIVKFKSSKATKETSSKNVTSDGKKRPASTDIENGAAGNAENVAEDNKRMKMGAC